MDDLTTNPPDPSPSPPFVNFPHGVHVQPWGDGVMFSVVSQVNGQGMTAFLGKAGLIDLIRWLGQLGILDVEINDEPPTYGQIPVVMEAPLSIFRPGADPGVPVSSSDGRPEPAG